MREGTGKNWYSFDALFHFPVYRGLIVWMKLKPVEKSWTLIVKN